MNIRFSEKSEFETTILLNHFGILISIVEGIFDISNTRQLLYSPQALAKIRKYSVDTRIVDQIERACELYDMKKIIPDAFEEEVKQMLCETKALIREKNRYYVEKEISFKLRHNLTT